MASEKNILTIFALSDLQAAARKLQVTVQDRRRKDALVAGLHKDKDTSFETVLGAMPAGALKEVCAELNLTVSGRGKAAWVAALIEATPKKKAAKPAAPVKVQKAAPQPARAAKDPAESQPKKRRQPAAKASAEPPHSVPAAGKRRGQIAQAQTAQAQAEAPSKRARAAKVPGPPKAVKAAAPAHEDAPAQPAAQAKPDAPDGQQAPAAAQEPAKKPAARRGPLSWSEAAQMAEHRGQSAATMLRAPTPQASGTAQHTCSKCHKKVTVQACQVQACNNYYVAAPGRKICSECLFERNTISMDDFNDRLHEERQCSHCGVPMTHLAATSGA